MTPGDLEAFLAVARKYGARSLKIADVEVQFGPVAQEIPLPEAPPDPHAEPNVEPAALKLAKEMEELLFFHEGRGQ